MGLRTFITAITRKPLVLGSSIQTTDFSALSAFGEATSSRYPDEEVELVPRLAHTNGSCRGCCLYWTVSPLFNYVFAASLFAPEEGGNTELVTVARASVSRPRCVY